ncbi:sodium:solute symporter family transporter [Streptomyces massasporeus]|uniref:sodium:solute symporter family transporter n=1 Tax=Streptomyces massasporeus TaxID=67324 RepID=UPI003411BBF6
MTYSVTAPTGRVALITLIACVVFPTALTTVSSATFAAPFAHDVFARGRRRRTQTGEVRALRVAAVIVCPVGLSPAAAIHRYPTDSLAASSIGDATSCIVPALIHSFFWRRFNHRGLCGPSTEDCCPASSSQSSRPSPREPSSRGGRQRVSTGIRSRPQDWFPHLRRSPSGGSAAPARP